MSIRAYHTRNWSLNIDYFAPTTVDDYSDMNEQELWQFNQIHGRVRINGILPEFFVRDNSIEFGIVAESANGEPILSGAEDGRKINIRLENGYQFWGVRFEDWQFVLPNGLEIDINQSEFIDEFTIQFTLNGSSGIFSEGQELLFRIPQRDVTPSYDGWFELEGKFHNVSYITTGQLVFDEFWVDGGYLTPAYTTDVFNYVFTPTDWRNGFSLEPWAYNEDFIIDWSGDVEIEYDDGHDGDPDYRIIRFIGDNIIITLKNPHTNAEQVYNVTINGWDFVTPRIRYLRTTNGTISPEFSPFIYEYELTIDDSNGGILLYPYIRTRNGDEITWSGTNTEIWTATVTNPNNNLETVYTIHLLNRHPRLYNIITTNGTFSSEFDPNIFEYEFTIDNTLDWFQFSPRRRFSDDIIEWSEADSATGTRTVTLTNPIK